MYEFRCCSTAKRLLLLFPVDSLQRTLLFGRISLGSEVYILLAR